MSQSVHKFNSLPDSQSTIQPVYYQSSHSVNQSNIISSEKSTIQTVTAPFKRKLIVCCESWFLTQFAILDSCVNRESRNYYQEQAIENIESRIKSCGTENKRLTHDWFLDNFTKTYSCNTTQHGHIHASNCMLAKRPIQVVKWMKPLKETNLGVHEPTFFWPLKETILFQCSIGIDVIKNFDCMNWVNKMTWQNISHLHVQS